MTESSNLGQTSIAQVSFVVPGPAVYFLPVLLYNYCHSFCLIFLMGIQKGTITKNYTYIDNFKDLYTSIMFLCMLYGFLCLLYTISGE